MDYTGVTVKYLKRPQLMKIAQPIIDFNGMQFKTERSIDQRLSGRGRLSSTRRPHKQLTRNVRGVMGHLFGF